MVAIVMVVRGEVSCISVATHTERFQIPSKVGGKHFQNKIFELQEHTTKSTGSKVRNYPANSEPTQVRSKGADAKASHQDITNVSA